MIVVNTSVWHASNMLVYPLEPQQNNLSNSVANSELYLTSKMECFAKLVNS